MSPIATQGSPGAPDVSPAGRLEDLFGELAELAGQRNAIDGSRHGKFAHAPIDVLPNLPIFFKSAQRAVTACFG